MNFVYGTCPASCMRTDSLFSFAQISIIWGWFWLRTTNVCTLLFTSTRCHPVVSLHLFPFSAVQHSQKDACCQQQHRYFMTAHNQQHFQAPIQEFG
jgi:hypothetical protein